MDFPLQDTEFDFDKELDLQNQELPFSSLKVFYYNHPPPSAGIEDIPYLRICHALSATKFYGQLVFAKFWAAIDFGSCIVLTARGQPFGFSMYTNEFWSNRIACLDQNSYVHPKNQVSVRDLAGRAFLDRTTKWTHYASMYDDNLYPQQQVASIFFMPVIEADRCFGVLEISMTNLLSDTCSYQVLEVCIALKEQGLQSSHKIENINIATSEDRHLSKKQRTTKADRITRNDITKLFGLSKKGAAEYFGIAENTFTKVHRSYGIEYWPCKQARTRKSSAHDALIREAPSKRTISDEDKQLKDLEYRLMQDNSTDIICDVNLVEEHMDNINYLMSNEDERIEEQPDECPQPVLLELYR